MRLPLPFHGPTTIAAPARPMGAQFGPFVGRFLSERTPAHTQAGAMLARLHQDPWEGARVLRDTWQPPKTSKTDLHAPVAVGKARLRIFADATALLGQEDGGTTTWHPFVFALANPCIPLVRTRANATPGNHTQGVTWHLVDAGCIAPKTGALPLQRAWPQAVADALEQWDEAFGQPMAVHHPACTRTGVFSPAAPFGQPDSGAIDQARRLVQAALTTLAPQGDAYCSLAPHQPGTNGGIVGGEMVFQGPQSSAWRRWIHAAVGHPDWPLHAGQSLVALDTRPLKGGGKAPQPDPWFAVRLTDPPSSHARLHAQHLLASFPVPLTTRSAT